MTAIGLMSGTSMDGIDCALIRSDGENRVERLGFAEFAYEPAFKQRIEALLEAAKSLESAGERSDALASLEADITRRHGDAVAGFLDQQGLAPDAIDLIGFHGQTMLHRPKAGFTVQLGDGEALASMTGIATVYDLRRNDMAHGGQGAPLVPVYHRALAQNLPDNLNQEFPACFVNIGGISNITWVAADGEIAAFDSGPGNALIDQWVAAKAGIPLDQGGAIASEGGVVKKIAGRYLSAPYFEREVPKSLDRADFVPLDPGEAELADGARTLAHVSAAAIVKACDHLPEPPKLWIVCGGGRKNGAIMADLVTLAGDLNGGKVIVCDEAGFNGDAMEAEAWAYLAMRSVKGMPLTFPATTGCRKPVSGGRLALPDGDLKIAGLHSA
ncbi:anhydro-N-acetylmuramic acid kinase [Salaquimonas pukyongi]|uniref:anhydro-N-acetylmuramic acid kinase n=1 Tax=Salaquimonas pukyongi TaxID=2712698 RepID=UPI001FCCCF50|nr:anhydro-N-acetylmuramic acid kinase [Salaquimonas pukyongi]